MASPDHQSANAQSNGISSKLRYPLRSVVKSKEVKATEAESAMSVPPRRGRIPSALRRSVNVLDLSSTGKACKPPRRLSVPSKPALNSCLEADRTTTPTVENMITKTKIERMSTSPVSDIPRSNGRRKFTVLGSVSYWLSQIKLSESASKHSISLGFFKLAMEFGCEPAQRMRDELKSYALRHDLITQLGEPARELFQTYDILEDLERLKISDSCSSQAASEGTKPLKEAVNRIPPTQRGDDMKSRSLCSNANHVTAVTKMQKIRKPVPAGKTRASCSSIPVSAGSAEEGNGDKKKKKKPGESNKGMSKISRSTRQAISGKADASVVVADDAEEEEDKENHDTPIEVTPIEVTQEERS